MVMKCFVLILLFILIWYISEYKDSDYLFKFKIYGIHLYGTRQKKSAENPDEKAISADSYICVYTLLLGFALRFGCVFSLSVSLATTVSLASAAFAAALASFATMCLAACGALFGVIFGCLA